MAKIFVIGICGNSVFMETDHFHQKGETVVAKSCNSEYGGKGFNQAVAAARMGAEVSFLGAVGSDTHGKGCEEVLLKEGIKPCLAFKDATTASAFILTDKYGENQVTVYRGASLASEDVYAYNKELNHIFYVIKVIFCDYVKVKKDICEIQKVDQIIELIYLGFEYDNDNKLSLKTACNILFLWGKLKLENDLVSKELTSTVFEKENNKQLMIKILCKIFTYMIEDNPIFLDLFEEFSQSTFILITLYPDAFIQLSNDIIQNSSLDQNEKQRMTMQFKELMNVYQNYDTFISSLINFQEKIKTLYQVVKEIILNHNRI